MAVFAVFERVGIALDKSGGGVEGNRTPDLLIANEALYQLSYNPALAGGGTMLRTDRASQAARPPKIAAVASAQGHR
jgi:hypothetical protein